MDIGEARDAPRARMVSPPAAIAAVEFIGICSSSGGKYAMRTTRGTRLCIEGVAPSPMFLEEYHFIGLTSAIVVRAAAAGFKSVCFHIDARFLESNDFKGFVYYLSSHHGY